MKRLVAISAIALLALAAVMAMPRYYCAIGWQFATASFASPPSPSEDPFLEATDWSARLVVAANEQIGVTVTYDPAYVKLSSPGGDPPRERGVCTDVVIRTLRDAHGIDLQQLVNRDMKRRFRPIRTIGV